MPRTSGRVLELDRLVHLVEAEADQRRALVVGAADRRSGLGDLDLAPSSLTPHRLGLGRSLGRAGDALAARHQVGDLLAAALRDRLRAGLLAERLEGRADHVVGVGRADRLGHHVGDAQALEHGAHRAAGDDAGAGRSRADIDAAGAEMADAVMVQGAAVAQRHADHRLLGRRGRLGDRLGHLARLAVAEAGPALAVADDDQSREAEALAALHRLGDAVDVDELLDQLLAAFVVAAAAAAAIVATAAAAAVAAAAPPRPPRAPRSRRRGSRRAASAGARLGRRSAGPAPARPASRGLVGFVSHHQNSNPPSRAASASALTRP